MAGLLARVVVAVGLIAACVGGAGLAWVHVDGWRGPSIAALFGGIVAVVAALPFTRRRGGASAGGAPVVGARKKISVAREEPPSPAVQYVYVRERPGAASDSVAVGIIKFFIYTFFILLGLMLVLTVIGTIAGG